jgi:hypothetical protein
MQVLGTILQGSSSNLIGTNQLHLCGPYPALKSGVLETYKAWLSSANGVPQSCKFATYVDSAAYPGALVAGSESNAQLVPALSPTLEYILASSGGTITVGLSYWLAILTDAADTVLNIAYENGVGDLKYGTQTYTSGFPDPLPGGFSDIAFQYSIAAFVNDGSMVLGKPPSTRHHFGPF